MSSRSKKVLKTLLPIFFGLFLVWYWYRSTSTGDREQIFYYIREADLLWVGFSIFLGILSHISRAIRWNYLLEPMGYRPSIVNNVFLILIAYFANLGIPRSGEILRATGLATYEGVPFEKGFGTIVTERVIDVLMLLLVVMAALALQTNVILGFLEDRGFNVWNLFLLLGGGLLASVFFAIFIKKSSHSLALRIKTFVKGLLDGVFSIFKMKKVWPFVLHTFFIWACYIGMLWVIKFTVPETIELGLSELLVAFVAGAFAMAATNGGVGLYPLAVSKALAVYGISSVSGDAFGWIMWISQTLMVVFFGAISFLILPLWNRNR
ncbi:MAG: lysylphosphatidylglycerol synthase transmembrane domain-containing protein [Bacteroidota bacterium]